MTSAKVVAKNAGLRSSNSSDLNSACFTVLVPVKIFQFSDMHNKNRFLEAFRRHNDIKIAGFIWIFVYDGKLV